MVPTIGIAEMYVQDNGIILPGPEGMRLTAAHCNLASWFSTVNEALVFHCQWSTGFPLLMKHWLNCDLLSDLVNFPQHYHQI